MCSCSRPDLILMDVRMPVCGPAEAGIDRQEPVALDECRLKGTLGDKVNAVLSAAAMTFSKLLAALGALLSFLLARLVVRFALRSPRRILAAAAG